MSIIQQKKISFLFYMKVFVCVRYTVESLCLVFLCRRMGLLGTSLDRKSDAYTLLKQNRYTVPLV